MTRVTLYTKPGCHLCEAVEQVIARVRKKQPFDLEIRNIDDSAADLARYHAEIPVVLVNGREIARYRLSTAEFEAALGAAARISRVLMTKLPLAGQVKTRLMPELSSQQAADVHRMFLRQVVRRLSATGRLVVCFDPPDAEAAIHEIIGPDCQAKYLPQALGDLGARLAAAFAALAPDNVLFLGVDSPDVPAAFLTNAAKLVQDNDVVIGPCDDGGYWCLGLSPGVDAVSLLMGIEWSSGRELGQTLDRARSLGWRVALADSWDDVDRPDDLRRLVMRLRKSDNSADAQLLRNLEQFLPPGVME